METEAIRMFVEAARLGSFAAAARELDAPPSSVSRVVAGLEEALDVRLFQRTTRRLTLTEAGRAYLERVEPLVRELESAAEVAKDMGQTPRGLLRVAAPGPFAALHLGRWLVGFATRFPEIDVELVLDSRVTNLVSERVDAAVRLGNLGESSVVAKRLCAMARVVVAAPDYLERRPVGRPEDVRAHPCLLFPYPGYPPVWRFRDAKRRVTEVSVRGRFVIPDGLILRDLALAGMGLALLPRWMCAEHIHGGRLVDVFPRHDVTPTEHDAAVWLAYPSRTHLPRKVRVFVDHVAELFRDGPPWERAAR